jgi:hypothetical protein
MNGTADAAIPPGFGGDSDSAGFLYPLFDG